MFGRRSDKEDHEPPEPFDDAADFGIRHRQQKIRDAGIAHTRKKMEALWQEILASLQRDRDRMKFTDEG